MTTKTSKTKQRKEDRAIILNSIAYNFAVSLWDVVYDSQKHLGLMSPQEQFELQWQAAEEMGRLRDTFIPWAGCSRTVSQRLKDSAQNMIIVLQNQCMQLDQTEFLRRINLGMNEARWEDAQKSGESKPAAKRRAKPKA